MLCLIDDGKTPPVLHVDGLSPLLLSVTNSLPTAGMPMSHGESPAPEISEYSRRAESCVASTSRSFADVTCRLGSPMPFCLAGMALSK